MSSTIKIKVILFCIIITKCNNISNEYKRMFSNNTQNSEIKIKQEVIEQIEYEIKESKIKSENDSSPSMHVDNNSNIISLNQYNKQVNSIINSIYMRDLELLKILSNYINLNNIKFNDNSNLVHLSVNLGFPEIAIELINRGVNPNETNYNGERPLLIAIFKKDIDMAYKLLNTKKIDIYSKNRDLLNYLHIACFLRREQIVRILLQYEKDEKLNGELVLSKSKNDTPLDIIIFSWIKTLKELNNINNDLITRVISQDKIVRNILQHAFNRNVDLTKLSNNCEITNDNINAFITTKLSEQQINNYLNFIKRYTTRMCLVLNSMTFQNNL